MNILSRIGSRFPRISLFAYMSCSLQHSSFYQRLIHSNKDQWQKGPKIFQIGFNKCGTRSLEHFFRQNGIRSAHFLKGYIAQTIIRNIRFNRLPLEKCDNFEFYSDMIWVSPDRRDELLEAYKEFKFLYAHYPDAYFILNTRDIDRWITSRFNHVNGKFWKKVGRSLGISSPEELESYWREDWLNHHQDVMDFFKDKPMQLLVFDIENGSSEKIKEFLEPHYRIDPTLYQKKGETKIKK